MKIHHIIENKPLGTAGAVKQLEKVLKGDFLVISGDIMFDIDVERLIKFHQAKNGIATIVVHPNDHPFDSDLIDMDADGKINRLLIRKGKTQPTNIIFRNLTNTSIYILNHKIFNFIPKNKKNYLEENIFLNILESKQKIYAYNTAEYIKDMGTPNRLKIVREDYKSGKIPKLNKENKRRAIFLDRDGTINMRNGIHDVRFNDFKLFPFTIDAVKKINQSNYLAIVVTNQPAIAKGFMTLKELDNIHKKLEAELGWSGAKLDAIYYCPHHPEVGFNDEIKELKIKCNCRKPKIGMIKQAVRDFNIDIKESFFIGDTTRDAKTAERAGIKFLGVRTGYGVSDNKYPVGNLKMFENLISAVNYILP